MSSILKPRMQLTETVIEQARQRLNDAPMRGLTRKSEHLIGLEIEFFLKNKNGALANLAESQNFLKELSTFDNWGIFQTHPSNQKIISVSHELTSGRYHSVKYEHPPHLLEIALSYENNLVALRDSLAHSIETLQRAGKIAGMVLDFSPFAIPNAPLNWDSINQIGPKFQNLNQSRSQLLHQLHLSADTTAADFTAYLAATQYHISGFQWWDDKSGFMERLYQSEAIISTLAFENVSQFEYRWTQYKNVFSHMKLLGFPQIQNWNFENWINQIIKDNPLENDLFNMRDLQLIKPKWIGTLEYRSDISSANTEKVTQLGALRFASYLNAQKPEFKGPLHQKSFLDLSRDWHSGKFFETHHQAIALIKEQAWQALKERGLGEEGLL